MKVCVLGLWHLGSVTAACTAAAGHEVVGLDFDADALAGLAAGRPPVSEPGLDELLADGLANGRLSFTGDAREALAGAEVLWVTYDTPVDEDDEADVEFVLERVRRVLPQLDPGATVIVSSQLPAGTTAELERSYRLSSPSAEVAFAYSPENLRLGNAIESFTNPDRVVVGIGADAERGSLERLLAPITDSVEWMSVESAEMTKHAINAFLATSVAFANELGVLCEQVGADAREVERGLKTERRIGPGAYVRPGRAFAGGTLARDVVQLERIAARFGLPARLVEAVRESNDSHKAWSRRRLEALFAFEGGLSGRRVAVWGLTYKPGTDTLRRSASLELCRWLRDEGVHVSVHDPAIGERTNGLDGLSLCATAEAALDDASALVLETEWESYLEVSADALPERMKRPLVLDAGGFLAATLGTDPRIDYVTVGRGSSGRQPR
jgi:UDPglucose 6-dehydrogenase